MLIDLKSSVEILRNFQTLVIMERNTFFVMKFATKTIVLTKNQCRIVLNKTFHNL